MRSILAHQLHENCGGMHWCKVSMHSRVHCGEIKRCVHASECNLILSSSDLFISPGAPRGFLHPFLCTAAVIPASPSVHSPTFFFLSCDVLLGRGVLFQTDHVVTFFRPSGPQLEWYNRPIPGKTSVKVGHTGHCVVTVLCHNSGGCFPSFYPMGHKTSLQERFGGVWLVSAFDDDGDGSCRKFSSPRR